MRTALRARPVVLLLVSMLVAAGCTDSNLVGPQAPTTKSSSTDNSRLTAPPPGYYDTVDTSSPGALRATLHDVIDDHTRFPYTSSSTDTWDILEQADQDPNDAGNILDVYRNASYAKQGGGNSFYNREHTWPNSYGYPNDNSSNYPFTDCHALFLCDSGYNSSRSNKPYRTCDATCNERTTEFNNGTGGGSGTYPGNSNWTSGSFTAGTWETWVGRRGDVARALLYMDVRYEGGTHGVTSVSEPDLILTDDEGLIASSNTGSNESVAYMGMLAVLLQWHAEDPVDALEQSRNDVIFNHQGNRNPFIDHPEWVDCIFSGNCGGGDPPPAPPTNLVATGGDGQVTLDWDDNGEPDLDGYNIYRATSSGGPYTQLNGSVLSTSNYTDTSVTNGTTYYYVATAVDVAANESGNSNEASATPQGGGGTTTVWINEFHYDNKKADVGEFVEVAGTAGTNLSGWQLLGYNGATGGVYDTINLSGSLPDQQSGFGTLSFAFVGLQNGAPDGIALVDDGGAVVEFLSYEGSFTATSGAAAGMTSTDVGVVESGGTKAGDSLQRTGNGTQAADFPWQGPLADSPGSPNSGQSFGGGGDTTPPAAPSNLVATAGDAQVDLNWDDNGEPDLDGYNVYRATTSGGPYTQVNGAILGASAYTDTGLSNGTTYYYVVTAVDVSGNESADSNEASATPTGGTGGDMHVASIVVSAVQATGRHDNARAVVTIVDALGNPVAGAQVTGTFTGDIQETISGTTDVNGVVELTSSNKARRPITFTFCVDNVTKPAWSYDSNANAETCDTFGPT